MTRRTLLIGAATYAAAMAQPQARKLKVIVADGHPAAQAAAILKPRPVCAGQANGSAVCDSTRYDQFRQLLETEGPDVPFTRWPLDQHRDHRVSPASCVNITATETRKRAACYAHASQIPDRYYALQDEVARISILP